MTKNYKKRKRQLTSDMKIDLGCCVCKYNTDPTKLHFHHIDPKTKYDNVSTLINKDTRISTILNEIEKCICICYNCHRKIHTGEVNLNNINSIIVPDTIWKTYKAHRENIVNIIPQESIKSNTVRKNKMTRIRYIKIKDESILSEEYNLPGQPKFRLPN